MGRGGPAVKREAAPVRTASFVMAVLVMLVTAIHAFHPAEKRRGCPAQGRARRLDGALLNRTAAGCPRPSPLLARGLGVAGTGGALDDDALLEREDAVHAAGEVEVVRGDERGEAGAADDVDERAHHVRGGMDVEIAGG